MNNDKRIDDIISMLDGFTSENVGHINIEVNDDNVTSKKVDMANSLDCSSGNMACKVPTLFEGIDDNN
ncbi:hypothetical protein [[Clostridium] colinum]|uniref:hypothetical protein n=1 Tax=[Clostridium] colinum TaxID=36835 RepID=UPI00202576CB|nr:hypothetical protein [[Clostridium] colinum]